MEGREGRSTVSFKNASGTAIRIVASGDGKLSKGVLGAIPIYLIAESENIKLTSGQKLSWEMSIEPK